jgi:hypothetical protein
MLCVAMLLRGTAIFESKFLTFNSLMASNFLVQVIKNGKCEGVIEYEPALTVSVEWNAS